MPKSHDKSVWKTQWPQQPWIAFCWQKKESRVRMVCFTLDAFTYPVCLTVPRSLSCAVQAPHGQVGRSKEENGGIWKLASQLLESDLDLNTKCHIAKPCKPKGEGILTPE